jgi:hypothetical protein
MTLPSTVKYDAIFDRSSIRYFYRLVRDNGMQNNWILKRTSMQNDMVELVERLKRGAIGRCRERIIEAREKPTEKNYIAENCRKDCSLASTLKKRHGLI